jgi:hypothetical protein
MCVSKVVGFSLILDVCQRLIDANSDKIEGQNEMDKGNTFII